MSPETLAKLVDAVANRVLERLDERGISRVGGALLTTTQVAERLGVSQAWVYAHASELGVIRLGSGDRPRLRFDPETVAERLSLSADSKVGPQHVRPPRPPRRTRQTPGRAPLLPTPARGH